MFGKCEGDHSDLLLLQQNFFDTVTSLLNTFLIKYTYERHSTEGANTYNCSIIHKSL